MTGTVHQSRGRYAEAEQHVQAAPALSRRMLGEEHPNTLGSICNLGLFYNGVQRFDEAAEMLEVNLPVDRRVLGMQHPWTGLAMQGPVTAYLGLGRIDEALPLQRELLELQTAAADQAGADATALNDAAWTLLTAEPESLQNPVRALGYAERACALLEVGGVEQPGNALDNLALAQHRTGDTAAAAETQRRALSLMPEGADPTAATRLAEYEAALEDK